MTTAEFLRQPFWAELGMSLAHFLWQGAAVALLLAVGLAITRRRPPETRYSLCLLAMIALALCPPITLRYVANHPPAALTLSTTSAQAATPAAFTTSSTNTPPPMTRDNESAIPDRPAQAVASPHPPARPGNVAVVPSSETADGHRVNPDLSLTVPASDASGRISWILGFGGVVWCASVLLLSSRFVFAWVGLQRLRRKTEALTTATEQIAARLLRSMGLSAQLPVRASAHVREPLAFGLLRPIVVIPASLLTQCPVEMIEAVIAHELAHIRRRDLWINLFQRAVETLLFYHPAVWWVSGRMRLERELCCDDLAVRATGKRADYAEALVTLSRSLHGWATPVLTAGMLGARLSLGSRIRRVLQGASSRHDPNMGRNWVTGPLTIVPAGLFVLMAALHATRAEDRPTTSAPAASRPTSTRPAWWQTTPETQSTDAHTTTIREALDYLSEWSGLTVIGGSNLDLTREVSFPAGIGSFDAFLESLNHALFEQDCWAMPDSGQPGIDRLIIHPVNEWHAHMSPRNQFASPEFFHKARLRSWDIASVAFRPARAISPNLIIAVQGKGALLVSVQNQGTEGHNTYVFRGFVQHLTPLLVRLKQLEAQTADTRPAETPRPRIIRPLMDGMVMNVRVSPGQKVKKGDLLVQLDAAETELELQAAEAQLELAASRLKFVEQAHKDGTVSQEEMLTVQSTYKTAEVELRKLRLRLDRTRIVSPIDGVIVERPGGLFSSDWFGKSIKAGEPLFEVHAPS